MSVEKRIHAAFKAFDSLFEEESNFIRDGTYCLSLVTFFIISPTFSKHVRRTKKDVFHLDNSKEVSLIRMGSGFWRSQLTWFWIIALDGIASDDFAHVHEHKVHHVESDTDPGFGVS